MKEKSVNRNHLNPSLLVETENNKYVLSEPVSKEQMYHLMLNLLEQDYFREDQLLSSEMTRNYLTLSLSHYEYEVFGCLFLDGQHRVICFEELFVGSLSGCSVYPRTTVKKCLHHNAAAVIFAHNHPSGDCTPSGADKLITSRLKSALELVEVRVLDHVIVGGTETLSFAERGLL